MSLPKTYSISEIVKEVKDLLEGEFYNISIQGEVTNISGSAAGHYYFNLSDDQASISCALFRGDALRNSLIKKVKDGDKLLVSGSISVYLKRGTFQLIAKKVSFFGKGDLKAQYEFLKKKLGQEGLFDLDLKKGIPKFPERIAVITALKGAALQDFLNIMQRRSFRYNILILPALMQGDNSASSVLKALKTAQSLKGIELIVVTRGGGAIEDLWSFNDEKLVRAIAACSTPVISAIGHQTDYTLCDLVSDLRCETPSSAAEILSSPQVELMQKQFSLARRLRSAAREFRSQLNEKILKLNPKSNREILKNLLQKYQFRLQQVGLHKKVDLIGFNQKNQYLDELYLRMEQGFTKNSENKALRMANAHTKLLALDPKQVLLRGYSIVSSMENEVLTSGESFDKLNEKTQMKIQFHDGERYVIKKS